MELERAMTPPLDLKRLRALAEAASQGVWQQQHCDYAIGGIIDDAYIAAFYPVTAIQLLDRISELEKVLTDIDLCIDDFDATGTEVFIRKLARDALPALKEDEG